MNLEFLSDGPPGQEPVTPEILETAEARLGVTLPRLYLDLLHVQNGGYLEAVQFDGIPGYSEAIGIHWYAVEGLGGDSGMDSGDGETRNQLLIRSWSFPAASVVFAFQGHGGLAFDYTECGPQGEPSVILVNADCHPGQEEILRLAPTFAAFLAHLSPVHGTFQDGWNG